MRLHAVFRAACLAAAAGAVMVEEAFKRDWVHHPYGTLHKVTLLDSHTLLGLSDKHILYGVATDSRVSFAVDLAAHGHTDFTVLDTVIVGLGSATSAALFDKRSGVYIASVPLSAAALQLEEAAGSVVLLLADGSLLCWDGSVHDLGTHPAESFIVDSGVDGATVSLGAAEIVLSRRDGVLAAEHKSSKHSLPPSQQLPPQSQHILQSASRKFIKNILLDVSGQSMSISRKSGSAFQVVAHRHVGVVSDIQVHGTFAVIPSESALYVYDFSKFLDTGREADLQTTELRAFPGFVSSSVDNGKLAVLAVGGSEAIVTSVDLETLEESAHALPLSALSASGKAVIVDVPTSLSKINELHHMAEVYHSSSLLYRLVSRYNKHLSSLGHAVTHLFQKSASTADTGAAKYGFEKIYIFDDKAQAVLAAKSTRDGKVLWTHPYQRSTITDLIASGSKLYVFSERAVLVLDVRTGALLQELPLSEQVQAFKLLRTTADDELEENTVVGYKSNGQLTLAEDAELLPHQHLISQEDGAVRSYIVAGEKIVSSWAYQSDEEILLVAKNSDDLTVAAGISRSDRSVLYKYLNPNLVTVITKSQQGIRVVLLDGVTGSLIHTQEHDEDIDPKSINLVVSDNWVVYSYFVVFPKRQQRIVAVDLFEDRPVATERSSHTPGKVHVSTKSFIYPERILSLAVTKTKFGITVRSVLALTDSGSLVELPKFLLNSRRVSDRKPTPEDYTDDFQMTPYEPILLRNTFQVLNHKNKLLLDEGVVSILTQPTDLESTSVVCLVSALNEFCTLVQPSLSYDLLQASFAKEKLLLTIVVLLAGYLFTKPFVYSRKLNANWEG